MIHIALAFNSNIDYNRFAVVLVDSIRRTTDAQVFYHFLVDNRDCRKDFLRLLEKLVAKSGNYSEVIDVGLKLEKRFTHAKHWGHVPTIGYARYLIPELVDVDERVIYLDCDIVVRRDLEHTLYQESIGNKPIGACIDKWLTCATTYKITEEQSQHMTELRETFGISAPVCKPVFHNGVLVYERSKMPCKTWMGDAIADVVTKNANRNSYSDMAAFDDAFAEKFVFTLPFKYMINATTIINNTEDGIKYIQSHYGLDLLDRRTVKCETCTNYNALHERVMTDAVLYHYTGRKDYMFFNENDRPVAEDLTMRYEAAVRYAKM